MVDLLRQLKEDDKPRFGLMTSQHMVEHLAMSVRFSNGRSPQPLYVSTERAQVSKRFILGDGEYPIGFKAPMLGDSPPPLIKAGLKEAIQYLENELAYFDSYFEANPSTVVMNPVLGELTYSEWIILHNKHFAYHFKQFNILSS
ncbi:MAG: hypothetical protein EOO85_13465 [Pedobacter sp.]|nr:MAG: hypothetical protein EOO85_13465 [Pedobacter sp.]